MKVIEADHARRYEIPGVLRPARKPVDIDATNTGFTHLRSLRLYQFEAGSTIDGHAEEDEVFVIVTSGSVEMKIGWEDSSPDAVGVYTLAAPDGATREPFVAYLPPRSVYQLTLHTAADVAYARATPLMARSPAVFGGAISHSSSPAILLEEVTHAEKLRLRIYRIQAQVEETNLDLLSDTDADCEVLVHIQGSPPENVGCVSGLDSDSLQLLSGQTIAFEPGESAKLRIPEGANVLILTVLAS